MPTYDYRCKACDHEFELVQSMSAPVKKKCPKCRKLKLERLIGLGAGFFVKGKASSPPSPAPDIPTKDAKPASKPTVKSQTSKADTSDTTSDTEKKAPPPPPEKRISGSTSTPTHKAREGRGVGNLVDKAKRIGNPSNGCAQKKRPSGQ